MYQPNARDASCIVELYKSTLKTLVVGMRNNDCAPGIAELYKEKVCHIICCVREAPEEAT
jgi:hypothetical protein